MNRGVYRWIPCGFPVGIEDVVRRHATPRDNLPSSSDNILAIWRDLLGMIATGDRGC